MESARFTVIKYSVTKGVDLHCYIIWRIISQFSIQSVRSMKHSTFIEGRADVHNFPSRTFVTQICKEPC